MCCGGIATEHNTVSPRWLRQPQLRPYPGIHEVMVWSTGPATHGVALHGFTIADGFRAYL